MFNLYIYEVGLTPDPWEVFFGEFKKAITIEKVF